MANQRAIEVHLLDHLDEIDRRGLALRRGFSSLFDYAVRELRFSDAAAQRRIQTMRLCRRHGWVRPMLHRGELSLTATAQLETAFAAAERQYRKASPNIGEDRCPDLLGQPGSPSAAGDRDADESGAAAVVAGTAAMIASASHGVVAVDQEAQSPRDAGGHEDRHTSGDRCSPSSRERAIVDARPAAEGSQPVGRLDSCAATPGIAPASTPATLHAPPQAAPGRAPRAGLAGELAAHTPLVPVADHAAAQHRGARHADALPVRLEANRPAAHTPAPAGAAGPAAHRSEQDPAAPLLPVASRAAPVPLPVVAPSEPRPTAAPAPEPSRGDPMADQRSGRELSVGPVSAAPLMHPRRQRELIEQAAGMTTRQVAGLLASAAPQVVPPRDTLRAVAPDRFTLKVSVDQECEQGLRQLKGLLSHVDPRMSWGDLVARLVREALARHDPRGGGRRRGHAGSTAASSRRERTRTTDAVPATAPAGGAGGDTPAPQGETTSAGEQPRAALSPNIAPVRGSAPTAPPPGTAEATEAPATRTGATALATHAATAAPEDLSAGARVPSPAARVPTSGAPRLIAPATPAGGVRQAAPSGAPGAAAAPRSTRVGGGDGADAAPLRPSTPPAPQLAAGPPVQGAGGVRQDAPSGAPGAAAARRSTRGGGADGTDAAPVPPSTPPAPQLACGVPPVHRAHGTPAGPSPQFIRSAPRGPRRSPLRRPIPAAVRRHVWLRDGGRCCYRDPLTGRRCNSAHLLQIDHLLPVAEGGGPEPDNLVLRCFAHHRLRHGYGPAPAVQPST